MKVVSLIHFMGSSFTFPELRLLFGLQVFAWPAMAHWLSGARQARKGTFFHVRVEPDFAASPAGRAILHTYRRRIWLWTLFVDVIYLIGSARSDVVSVPLWLLPITYAAMGGCVAAFYLAWRQTCVQAAAVPGPSVRTAALFAANDEACWWLDILDWLGMVLPLALPVIAAAILMFRWHQLPSNRIWFAVTGVILAGSFGIIPAGTQFALRYHARSSDWNPDPHASHKHRTLLGFMGVVIFTYMSLQFCISAVLPAIAGHRANLHFTFGWLIVISLLLGTRLWLVKNVSRESGDPMPDSCWKWGLYYVNHDDPALVVPARSGTGFSFNYGHRVIWLTWVGIAILCLTEAIGSAVIVLRMAR